MYEVLIFFAVRFMDFPSSIPAPLHQIPLSIVVGAVAQRPPVGSDPSLHTSHQFSGVVCSSPASSHRNHSRRRLTHTHAQLTPVSQNHPSKQRPGPASTPSHPNSPVQARPTRAVTAKQGDTGTSQPSRHKNNTGRVFVVVRAVTCTQERANKRNATRQGNSRKQQSAPGT